MNILDWCKENGNPSPTWREQAGSVYVTFWPVVLRDQESETIGQVTDKNRTRTGQVSDKFRLLPEAGKLLAFCKEERSLKEMMVHMNLRHQETFLFNHLRPLLNAEFLEMTIPDKPRSSKQKYRLTEKGRKFLSEIGRDKG